MIIHRTITFERVRELAAAADCLGACVGCGMTVDNVEPDTHEQLCEECELHAVYGAEELLLQELYN